MEGFCLQILLLPLFFIPTVVSQNSTTDDVHIQNIYPGCKRSENQSDTVPPPRCSMSDFLRQHSNHTGFEVVAFNATMIYNCSYAFSPDQSFDVFGGYILLNDKIDCPYCICMIIFKGPPGTFFKLELDFIDMDKFDDRSLAVYFVDGLYFEKFRTNAARRFISLKNHFQLTIFQLQSISNSTTKHALNISFQAVPDCLNQLQVNCISATSGYIQTLGWSEGWDYLRSMNTCVTLHVPTDHVIMVSLVSIDVEVSTSKCLDMLCMYVDTDCAGECPKTMEICEASDLLPTVLRARTVSFKFLSNTVVEKTGFRLLYSFHNNSEVPYQLPDGKWDCNVSYYDSFRQHFLCTAPTFCSDKRDKRGCPEHNELCGGNLVNLDGNCYRFFKPSSQITWNDAADTCSKYSGRLAVLNSASKWRKVVAFVEEIHIEKHVFIGLRRASTNAPEMYQKTWMWSDDTLAIYVNITFDEVDFPYCSAAESRMETLTIVSCDKKYPAVYLCEIEFAISDENENNTAVSLATLPDRNVEGMTICPHNYTTHTFLACDVDANCSASTQQEVLACSNKFSPSIPFFTCRNRVERVPYMLVCDFRSDCCDDSDEDFCHFPDCTSRRFYKCTDRKQCISRELVCDKRSDCVDGSDEAKCPHRLTKSELMNNTLQPPAMVTFTGYGDFIVTSLPNNLSCPDTHFQCPGDGYCVPVYVRCNEVYDCPGREDEMDCDDYICPGYYRCRESKICLHRQNLCDGVFQCPQHDDELLCNFTCPERCHCYGYAFICTSIFLAHNYTELRYLEARNTGMKPEDVVNNTMLIHLDLRNCQITVLEQLSFLNLQSLDLSYNEIQILSSNMFINLVNLISLTLAYNPVVSVDFFIYHKLQFPKILVVNFSGIAIPEMNKAFLKTFPNVEHLNMTDCRLTKMTLKGFQPFKSLNVLDLRGCPMDTFFHGIFQGLSHLHTIYTDNYKLCCPTVLPIGMESAGCHAHTDEVSSCDALLRTDVFRVFLALYAILALTGNLGSFVYRVFIERNVSKMGYEVFVMHLCIADFLMGVYLAIIGIADRIYYGNYRWYDIAWKHSVACKVAGFLSLVSSEVSAFLLCLITLERFLVINFPHKDWRFSRLSAHAASVVVWLIGLTLALIPLLPFTSHWQFYSQSGICIPLPITRKEFDGNDYSFAIMIIVNFILFLFIAFGQLLIYWSIRVNTVRSKDSRRKSKDTAIARRLLALVMTDFMCWFPIGVLGLMARSGVPISSNVNVAIAIFVLPFNSALNPFLYTINLVMERRRKIYQNQKSSTEDGGPRSTQFSTRVFDVETERKKAKNTFSKEEALKLLDTFLDQGLLTPDDVRRHVWDIYEG